MSLKARAQVSVVKTAGFIAIAVIANSFGNLLLAMGIKRMPDFAGTPFSHYLLMLIVNPYFLPGALLTSVYLIAQLSLFSWADLSYVVPLIASSYAVTTLLSEFVLDEAVDLRRWLGILLISAGVALVMRTPTRTAGVPDRLHP